MLPFPVTNSSRAKTFSATVHSSIYPTRYICCQRKTLVRRVTVPSRSHTSHHGLPAVSNMRQAHGYEILLVVCGLVQRVDMIGNLLLQPQGEVCLLMYILLNTCPDRFPFQDIYRRALRVAVVSTLTLQMVDLRIHCGKMTHRSCSP